MSIRRHFTILFEVLYFIVAGVEADELPSSGGARWSAVLLKLRQSLLRTTTAAAVCKERLSELVIILKKLLESSWCRDEVLLVWCGVAV